MDRAPQFFSLRWSNTRAFGMKRPVHRLSFSRVRINHPEIRGSEGLSSDGFLFHLDGVVDIQELEDLSDRVLIPANPNGSVFSGQVLVAVQNMSHKE